MEHLVFALQSPLLASILRVIRRRLQEGELTLAEVSEDADKVPADPQEHLHNLLDALAEFEPEPRASQSQSTARNVAVAYGLLKSLKSLNFKISLLRDVLEEAKERYHNVSIARQSLALDNMLNTPLQQILGSRNGTDVAQPVPEGFFADPAEIERLITGLEPIEER